MKKYYDFTKAEQGKFFRPVEDLEIPIYLDKKVKTFFIKQAKDKKVDLNELVNGILKKEMRIKKVS